MHPILAQRGRLILYLAAWSPIAGLLAALLVLAGNLRWVEALALAIALMLIHAFLCLSAWYLCRTFPVQDTSWIATGSLADPEREATLVKLGVQVHRLPIGRQSLIDLTALLKLLGEKGVNSLMVEGGAQIITNFLTSRLVDQVVVTIAPVVVGGVRVVDNLGLFNSGHFPRLSQVSYQQMGEDLVIRGEPVWPEA